MAENPFAQYDIDMPLKFRDKILTFCAKGSVSRSRMRAPFKRQVDFWYAAFLMAVKEGTQPEKEAETYKPIQGSILSTDPWRISHIQASYLAMTEDLPGLADSRKVFEFALGMANAGIPLLINLLETDDDEPLWAYLDEAENAMS